MNGIQQQQMTSQDNICCIYIVSVWTWCFWDCWCYRWWGGCCWRYFVHCYCCVLVVLGSESDFEAVFVEATVCIEMHSQCRLSICRACGNILQKSIQFRIVSLASRKCIQSRLPFDWLPDSGICQDPVTEFPAAWLTCWVGFCCAFDCWFAWKFICWPYTALF